MVRDGFRVLLMVWLLAACSGQGKPVISDVFNRPDAPGDSVSDTTADCASCDAADAPDKVEVADLAADTCGDSCAVETVCDPGTAVCEGNGVITCAEDGMGWLGAVPCTGPTTCEGGDCVPWPDGACAQGFACLNEMVCPTPQAACLNDCMETQVPGVAAHLTELFWCVVEQCDTWNPPLACHAEALAHECRKLAETCTGECVPWCGDAECGSDGCDGSCGECPDHYACDANGQCLCEPDCDGKECGPNGCGASCAVCPGRKPICNADFLCEKKELGPCTNGECEADLGENCHTCPADCGECPECGDGICAPEELCEFCAADCGPCPYGACCEMHAWAGCEDPDVEACVCDLEPDCCLKPWFNACVELAKLCGAGC